MADITYKASQDSPQNIPGFEQYQDSDKNLVTSYQVNSIFDSNKNFAELHILDLADTLLQSEYDYTQYTLLANAQSAGKEGASVLTIDPIQDALTYGFAFGGVKVLYHFLNDLYTSDKSSLDFYIDSISPDRTELRLLTQKLTPEQIVSYTNSVKSRLQDQSDFSEFRLNFKNNSILIAINIDTLDSVNGKAVVVKLYEPLPAEISKKATLSIVESISDSVAYELDYEVAERVPANLALRSPNFNLDLQEYNIVPTEYFNYDELLSYKVNNANSEIYSMINEKGVDLSIDYSDYSNFIHFSSAQERLLNFKYKVDLLTQYSQSLNTVKGVTGGPQGVSGSVIYYENLYQGIINNFDHYERFLYYESGSNSWPKSNTTKPYINLPSKDPVTNIAVPEVTTWFNEALTNSVAYDASNYNILTQTIPTYISDDDNNQNYLTFIYMIGQHFDNLWIYGKAVTDKYDADNRLNHGISKDLVGEALKNFGVKLYTSNKSTEDLFSALIGQAYQSGSEVINHYITGSLTGSNTPIQPSSYDGYQKEVQKRIYHNLPLLLKSKGTERGLRALINCFGIPSDILKIKLYGGRNVEDTPFFGDYQYYTSSLDKIRTDHTGSITSGSTLSQYTSIIHRDNKYTDDLHNIEVGFSPTDNIDNYIISQSASTFNIDNYIGDPRDLSLDSYSGLGKVAESILGNLDQYNLQDYVRLIKFFDNVIFKMIKDFIPARAIADTGIIIKPNLLNRSKAKSINVSGSQSELEYFATIDTAFISGSDGGVYENSRVFSTNYTASVQTPIGTSSLSYNEEQAKYNGELSGSHIVISTGEWNANNPYKELQVASANFDIRLVSSSQGFCVLLPATPPDFIEPNKLYGVGSFFTGITTNTTYTVNGNPIIPNPTFNFTGLVAQYGKITLIATDPISAECTKTVTNIPYGVCNLVTHPTISWYPNQPINLTIYLTTGSNDQTGPSLKYYAGTTPIANPTSYVFSNPNTPVVIKLKDIELPGCETSMVVNVLPDVLSPPITVSYYYFELYFKTPSGTVTYVDENGIQQSIILTNNSEAQQGNGIPARTGRIVAQRIISITSGIDDITEGYNSYNETPQVVGGTIKIKSITFTNLTNQPLAVQAIGYYNNGRGDLGEFEITETLGPRDTINRFIKDENTVCSVYLYEYQSYSRFIFTPTERNKVTVTFSK